MLNSTFNVGYARRRNRYASRTENLQSGFWIFAFVSDTGMKLGLITGKYVKIVKEIVYNAYNLMNSDKL